MRRGGRGGRAGRSAQRGVALIIALILVALAAILSTKLTYDGWLERRRAMGIIAAEQAYEFGLGAEAIAAEVLVQNTQSPSAPGAARSAPNAAQNSTAGAGGQGVSTAGGGKQQQVTLAQAWAQPSSPLPITAENDPNGEPIGTVQGSLEDMQGRFNLNNLGHVITGPDGKVQQDPVPLEQFQRLLVSVGLESKWAGLARDWIDADIEPGVPDGAEDSVYTSQNPPYRTGNWPMMSPTELMNLPGFGAERYRKIAPYVTALPTATAAINICTAPAQVLESLAESLNGEYSRSPGILTTNRKTGCFPDTQTLTNILGPQAIQKITGRFSENSQYFRLTTRIVLGTTQFTLYSLLSMSAGGKATPLVRTFGTL